MGDISGTNAEKKILCDISVHQLQPITILPPGNETNAQKQIFGYNSRAKRNIGWYKKPCMQIGDIALKIVFTVDRTD